MLRAPSTQRRGLVQLLSFLNLNLGNVGQQQRGGWEGGNVPKHQNSDGNVDATTRPLQVGVSKLE
eukprot:m.128852 g.128852  ORF g.128852 m.128852 type:complete len:65 (+) comp13878_c0_seq1:1577-1771(+)